MPKYYPINEEAAKRAKDMNSFSDYQPGSATAGYRAMVDEAYAAAERQKARVDPMYHDKIDALVDRYARKLAKNLNERNVIDARVPSILISGGGNFPVTKKHKQNAARDRNYGEYAEISKLLDKIRSVGMGGISADDDLAVEKLTKKLEGLESQQAAMKAVNAYFRKHKTLDGCPELTPEQAEKLKADMAQSWHLDKSKPYPAYLLSNNNANIRRVRQRIEELSSRSEFAGWTFPGGEAKINEAENRLQLIFEEKPDADQRQELKSNGFKWAPSQGAWQRQLKGSAYERWAKVYNLKQMAAALQSLKEHHLTDYAALTARTEAAVDHFHKLSDELRTAEEALSKTSELMAATVDYAKTRPVFDGYKAARYSKKYLAQHEAELATYRAAKDTMNTILNGAKLPKIETLKKSRRELAGQKKELYAEYREAQRQMREAVAVKANIDHLLGITDKRENKAQER